MIRKKTRFHSLTAVLLSIPFLAGLFPATGFAEDNQGQLAKLNCPALNQLVKNPKTAIWTAPGGWKAYEQSPFNKLTHFVGAQWVGIGVGQVSCLYRGDDPFVFPVFLVYNTLTFEPKDVHWSKSAKSNYRNCKSNKREDCLFSPVPKKKTDDIYKEAEKLKQS